MKKKNQKEEPKYLSRYEEDCIWMSYRYCIGRHTIAIYMHASDIAQHAYGRMTKERTQFMSEDICREIYDCLNVKNFVDFGWYGNIPKSDFKPLDVLYEVLDKESIDSYEKVAKIKEIVIEWNRDKKCFEHSIYYFNDNDKNKDYGRSFMDIDDLEIWQRLANLFDIEGHKWCKMVDGSECEYYETWRHHRDVEGRLKFKKYKVPVSTKVSTVFTYIDEQFIEEDNIKHE